MLTLHSSFYALVIATCLLCLVIARSTRDKRLAFFMVFLGLQALGFSFEWLMLHPGVSGKGIWLALLMMVSLFVAPCTWLFAREIAEGKTPSLRELPRRHYLWAGLGIVFTLPLLQTALGLELGYPQREAASEWRRLFVHGTMLGAIAIFLLQVPYYITQCIRVLQRQISDAKVLFANIDSGPLNALRSLVWIVCIHWLVSLLRTLHCMLLDGDAGLAYLALAQGAITVWALVVVVRQSSLFSVGDRNLISALGETGQRGNDEERAAYAKSALDEVTRQRVAGKLEDVLKREQKYRDSALNLRSLALAMGENSHYVSQVISQEFNTNFYELVNRERVQYAQQAMQHEPGTTLLDIAMEAGFNSKSTFNAAFKRHTGMTPSEFRKRIALQDNIQPEDLFGNG